MMIDAFLANERIASRAETYGRSLFFVFLLTDDAFLPVLVAQSLPQSERMVRKIFERQGEHFLANLAEDAAMENLLSTFYLLAQS